MKKVIRTKGMHCKSCEILLKEAIEEKGIKVVRANHSNNEIEVDVQNDTQLNEAKKVIEAEGYTIV